MPPTVCKLLRLLGCVLAFSKVGLQAIKKSVMRSLNSPPIIFEPVFLKGAQARAGGGGRTWNLIGFRLFYLSKAAPWTSRLLRSPHCVSFPHFCSYVRLFLFCFCLKNLSFVNIHPGSQNSIQMKRH